MFELKDYQKILADKASEVNSIFVKYPDTESLAKNFADINATKIRTVEPEIMVYGIYNAGKSSILNELMGVDKAKVADVPTTDNVTYYEWQGYKIADTPGVMAPIEHENVTEEHLKKADIVLFVMSTTGSNEKAENYQRMKSIADAGKKIIIVLNDKNGDLGKRDNLIQIIKQKVAVNMKQVSIEEVDEKYCIITVNAKRARAGRVKNIPELIAKSGLDELKDVILSELKRTTSFDILRTGIYQIESVLDEFIKLLETRENSETVKRMNKVLQTFNTKKINMRRDINNFIDARAATLGENLPGIVWADRDNQNRINIAFTDALEKLNKTVQNEIQRQLKDASDELFGEMKSFADLSIGSKTVDVGAFNSILAKLSDINKQPCDVNSVVAVPSSTAETSVDINQMGIATGLLTQSGAEIAKHFAKTAVGKAIANSVLGKVAGSVIPVIGPIITVVSILGSLKDWLGGNDDQKKIVEQIEAQNLQERRRVEAEMQARQEITQKCRYLADNIADELKVAADKSISAVLATYEEPFKQEIAEHKAEGEQIGNDIIKLRDIHNSYDQLRVELGAKDNCRN